MQSTVAPHRKPEAGFTLVEILVVVVILGILAGLVVPRLLDRPDEARQTQARVQIKQLEEALALFKLDNGFFPTSQQGLSALVTEPTTGKKPKRYPANGYIKKVPKDPWGGDFIYTSPGEHGAYDLSSYGKDEVEGGSGNDEDINNWEID